MRTLLLSLVTLVTTLQLSVAQNHPPVAVNDTVNAVAQVPLLINAIANDFDPDGNAVFMHAVNASSSAEVRIEGQLIWYKPAYWSGEQTINYMIEDDQSPALQDNGRVYVNVSPNPDAPVVIADTFDLVALIPHIINLVSNDYDPNGDEFKIVKVSSITSGCTVTINPDSVTVTVKTGLSNCSFRYQIRENNATGLVSEMATVQINTLPNPDQPVAVADTVYTIGGIPFDIAVLDNDYDPQEEAIEFYSITSTAQHGSHGIYGNIIRYTPHFSYSGNDILYYRIREIENPEIYSTPAKVNIFVAANPNRPVGEPDFASGMTGKPILIDVLANDHDPNGDAIQLKDVSYGTITADNKILYTSSFTSLGSDSIFYRVAESLNPQSYSEYIKVSIQLAVNPDLPVAVPDYITTRAGVPVTVKPLENDILNSNDTLILQLVSLPVNSPGFAGYVSDAVTYTPSYQAEGVQKVMYYIKSDSGYFSAMGNIYVNVLKQNYFDSLTINNINAGVSASGNLFNFYYEMPNELIPRDTEFYLHYRTPADGNAHTIFYNGFQLGGFDVNGNLHMSAKTGNWKAGPISNNQDTNYLKRYARVWKLSKDEIEFHRQNFWKQDYQPVEAIADWPGNGNISAGESANLAPYFDYNNDGNYNCMNGDYPLIRGDQCIFLICNDDKVRTDTSAMPVKAELHVMIYAFDKPADTALFNTVFVHYDVVNKSDNLYSNCFAGVFTDFDIGYMYDDRFRSDVQRGSVFCYNGKDKDGDGHYWAYGYNPPSQSLTVLGGPFIDPDGIDNPSGNCDESINGLNFGNGVIDDERHGLSRGIRFERFNLSPWGYDELNLAGAFKYLNGFWNDGTPVLFGGDGHIGDFGTAAGPECRFTHPGDSDPLNWGTGCELPNEGYNQNNKFWTEEREKDQYGDRRGLASMGPFTLAPGQVQEIDLAYCTGFGNNGPVSSVNQLLKNIDSLKIAVAQGMLLIPNSSLGINTKDEPVSLNLYPNPATDLIAISNVPDSGKAEFSIFNLYGTKVMSGNLSGDRPTVKIGNLTTGMYIIRITDGKYVSTGKFVKK